MQKTVNKPLATNFKLMLPCYNVKYNQNREKPLLRPWKNHENPYWKIKRQLPLGHKFSANWSTRATHAVTASRDNCFRTCCPSVRPSPLFKFSKTKQQKTMFATGEAVGLAEWIIDDTCLVFFATGLVKVEEVTKLNLSEDCEEQLLTSNWWLPLAWAANLVK